jgi:hypothetical protein
MIVITRNGRTTVLTGWRAWLVGALAFVVLVLIAAFLMFVVLGMALTLGAVLLIVLPAIGVVTLLGAIFGSGSPRTGR